MVNIFRKADTAGKGANITVSYSAQVEEYADHMILKDTFKKITAYANGKHLKSFSVNGKKVK